MKKRHKQMEKRDQTFKEFLDKKARLEEAEARLAYMDDDEPSFLEFTTTVRGSQTERKQNPSNSVTSGLIN